MSKWLKKIIARFVSNDLCGIFFLDRRLYERFLYFVQTLNEKNIARIPRQVLERRGRLSKEECV